MTSNKLNMFNEIVYSFQTNKNFKIVKIKKAHYMNIKQKLKILV